jgi:hypothetical protein
MENGEIAGLNCTSLCDEVDMLTARAEKAEAESNKWAQRLMVELDKVSALTTDLAAISAAGIYIDRDDVGKIVALEVPIHQGQEVIPLRMEFKGPPPAAGKCVYAPSALALGIRIPVRSTPDGLSSY